MISCHKYTFFVRSAISVFYKKCEVKRGVVWLRAIVVSGWGGGSDFVGEHEVYANLLAVDAYAM